MQKRITRHLRKAPNMKHTKTKQTNQKEELRKNRLGSRRTSLKLRRYFTDEIRTEAIKL